MIVTTYLLCMFMFLRHMYPYNLAQSIKNHGLNKVVYTHTANRLYCIGAFGSANQPKTKIIRKYQNEASQTKTSHYKLKYGNDKWQQHTHGMALSQVSQQWQIWLLNYGSLVNWPNYKCTHSQEKYLGNLLLITIFVADTINNHQKSTAIWKGFFIYYISIRMHKFITITNDDNADNDAKDSQW